MPFLGVYDNVRYSPNCTPTTYQHWGWGFVSEHFVPQVFFQTTLERGMADSNSIPFLYLYTNRRELLECIGKNASCRYENVFVHLSNYWTFLFMCF